MSVVPIGPDIYVEVMTLAAEAGAINLAQGFPEDELVGPVLEAAAAHELIGQTQYAPLHGLPELRAVLAERARVRGLAYDPESEITVTIGCTEAVAAALLAVTPPGAEILTPAPYYDSYPGLARMVGARLVPVPLAGLDGTAELDVDVAAVRRALTPATRVLLLNTPHNPTGFVLSEQSCAELARLAVEHDLVVVTDEVYEEHTYDGPHVRIAASPGMRERTVVCSSASKMIAVGGWRIGWAYAPRAITDAIHYHHRHLAFSAPAPLQAGVAAGLRWADATGYFDRLRTEYRQRRDVLYAGLRAADLVPRYPRGGFFVTADAGPWGAATGSTSTDMAVFAKRLIAETGVAALPLGDFFADPSAAGALLRFAFCKPLPVLREAAHRLSRAAVG